MEEKILVFDTETTGLEDHDQIIQLAWGWWDGAGGVNSPQSFKCMPTIEWESEWHEEHNLSMKDLAGLPPLDSEMFQPFISAVNSADVVLGYNVDFDLTVVERESTRLGIDSSYISTKPFIDPMMIWRKSEGKKLVDAHKRWTGIELEEAHDAEADVSGAVAILPGMLSEFGLDEMTIENLVQMCRENDYVDRTGKMKWLGGKPILTCTQFDYYDGKYPNMTVFEATWSDGGQYAQKYPSFKAMGYPCHKSVIDAFRLALNHHNDESGFIAAMIDRFGPPSDDAAVSAIPSVGNQGSETQTEAMTEHQYEIQQAEAENRQNYLEAYGEEIAEAEAEDRQNYLEAYGEEIAEAEAEHRHNMQQGE